MSVQEGQIVQTIQQAQQTPERTYTTPSEGADFSGVAKAFESFGRTLSSGQGSQKKTYDYLYDRTDVLRDKLQAKYNKGESVINSEIQRDFDNYYKEMGKYYTPSEIDDALRQKDVKLLAKPIEDYDKSKGEAAADDVEFTQKIGATITHSADAELNLRAGQAAMAKGKDGLMKLVEAGQYDDPALRDYILNAQGNATSYNTLISMDLDAALKANGGYMSAQQFESWKQDYSNKLSSLCNLPLETTSSMVDQWTGWYRTKAKEFADATKESKEEIEDYNAMLMNYDIAAQMDEVVMLNGKPVTKRQIAASGDISKHFSDVVLASNPDLVTALVSQNPKTIGMTPSNRAQLLGRGGIVGKFLDNYKTPQAKEEFQGVVGDSQIETNKDLRAALEAGWKESGITPDGMNVSMQAYVNATEGTTKDTWINKDKELQVFKDSLMTQGQANNKLYEGSWFYNSEGGLVQIDPETGIPHLLTMENGELRQRSWTDLTNQANKTFVQTQMKLIPQFIDSAAKRTGKTRQELAQMFNEAMITTSDAAMARMRKGGSANLQDFQGMLSEDRAAGFPKEALGLLGKAVAESALSNVKNPLAPLETVRERTDQLMQRIEKDAANTKRSIGRLKESAKRSLLESLGVQTSPGADLRDAMTKLETSETRRGDDGGAPTLSMPSTQVTTPKPNTTITAPTDGVVTFKGNFKGYGNMLVITEGDRNWILYGDGTETFEDIEQDTQISEGDPVFKTNSKGNMYIMLAQSTGKGKVKYLNAEEILQPRA